MSASAGRRRTRLWVFAGVTGGLLLFFGANAHLLYVALDAQPECVEHIKMPNEGQPAQFRAAKSAC
ncbi:hypothetical protein [Chelativorans sp. Marseille-P2723]|uniref:hypothetical protein n=1 Tax=Chelativorans sp. Marseille-P2723 TaxID=2709133 RepID=UPI00156D6E03|nr:hypothetical protein [Chelativorans sp. Marseille-P2723]